jgi:Helicase associated domain
MSQNATRRTILWCSIISRTAGGGGYGIIMLHNTTTVSTSTAQRRKHLQYSSLSSKRIIQAAVLASTALGGQQQQQQPYSSCFPPRSFDYFVHHFSSLSSPLVAGSVRNQEEHQDNDLLLYENDDAFHDDDDDDDDVEDFDDDEEEGDEDDEHDYDYVYGEDHDEWQRRWYKNLRRYEMKLLRQAQRRTSSSSSSSTIRKSSSSNTNTKSRTTRQSRDWLVEPTRGDATLKSWMKNNRRKYRHGVLPKEQLECFKKMLQRVISVVVVNSSSCSGSAGAATTTSAGAEVGSTTTAAAPAADDEIRASAAVAALLEPRPAYWHDMYQALCIFIQDHDGKFPYDYNKVDGDESQLVNNPQDMRLLYWCRRQKKEYKAYQQQLLLEQQPQSRMKNGIMEERIQKLEALGFVWDEHESFWNARYQELKAYHEHHGDCLVPTDYPSNPTLAKWVSDQRTMYWRYIRQLEQQEQTSCSIDVNTTAATRSATTTTTDETPSSSLFTSMTPRRLSLLQELDFCWNVLDAKWLQRYRELQEYIVINNTVHLRRGSDANSHHPVGGREDNAMTMMKLTTGPKLPKGPLKRWLKFQKKQYKEYLSTFSTNMNPPPPPPPAKQRPEDGDDDDDDDDQRILTKQLTLEKRFQLLQKLGFPWE